MKATIPSGWCFMIVCAHDMIGFTFWRWSFYFRKHEITGVKPKRWSKNYKKI